MNRNRVRRHGWPLLIRNHVQEKKVTGVCNKQGLAGGRQRVRADAAAKPFS